MPTNPQRKKSLGLWMATSLVVGNMIGAGRDTVFLGFMLLLAGLPVYVWVSLRRRGVVAEDE